MRPVDASGGKRAEPEPQYPRVGHDRCPAGVAPKPQNDAIYSCKGSPPLTRKALPLATAAPVGRDGSQPGAFGVFRAKPRFAAYSNATLTSSPSNLAIITSELSGF